MTTAPTAGVRRPVGRGWLLLAVLPLVLAACWLLLGQPGPPIVAMPRGHTFASRTVVVSVSLALSSSFLVGVIAPTVGLMCLGAIAFGLAVAWPMTVDHHLSGPVLMNLAVEHGVHRNDFLAIVPAAAGVICVLKAVQRIRDDPSKRMVVRRRAPGPSAHVTPVTDDGLDESSLHGPF